jgi:hypothetical protein
MVSGPRGALYRSNQIRIVECDPGGFWVMLSVRSNIGNGLLMTGALLAMASLILYLFFRKRLRKPAYNGQHIHDQHQ